MMLFGFGRVPGCLGLGALFLWDEWRDERTVCQRLTPTHRVPTMQPPRWQSVRSGFWGCEGVVVCREVVGHQRCAGCGWGEFFLGGVVRGLGIEAVLDRVWCFCVIFKFIFGVFWIIIMEKDGWPDWLRLTD
jgi:hypothetical protein